MDEHNRSGWATQAGMQYNGLGQRLSMNAADVIAHYVMDGDQALVADSGGNSTYSLYGLGAIGEKTTTWNYSLPDGTNTPRQLTDPGAEITLSARYTPWGDTLELHGTGNFSYGYFGGTLDASTGLLYVGHGQYYDPSTGRFLTREAKQNNANPYVPWDPTGAIIAPLGIAALFCGKKKGKKVSTFFILLLVVGSIGMTLAACQTTNSGYNVTATPSPIQPNNYTVTMAPATVPSSTATTTESPVPTITLICTVTPTLTISAANTPTPPVPTPINEERFYKVYNTLLDPQYTNYWWRRMDDGVEMIMAVMSYLEFRTIKSDSGYIEAATDALSNRYRFACPAGCPVVNGVLNGGFRWLMRWSHSLMQLENGMTRDLEQSTIDVSFAMSMGQSIIRDSKPYNTNRPWGAFNPQTDREFNYFRGKYKINGDLDRGGVYWWSPEGAKYPPVAIVITKSQSDAHCTTLNPEFGADKGITCGN